MTPARPPPPSTAYATSSLSILHGTWRWRPLPSPRLCPCAPQDVKDVAHTVLRHRVILSYEAEAEELTSDHLIDRLLDHVPVP